MKTSLFQAVDVNCSKNAVCWCQPVKKWSLLTSTTPQIAVCEWRLLENANLSVDVDRLRFLEQKTSTLNVDHCIYLGQRQAALFIMPQKILSRQYFFDEMIDVIPR